MLWGGRLSRAAAHLKRPPPRFDLVPRRYGPRTVNVARGRADGQVTCGASKTSERELLLLLEEKGRGRKWRLLQSWAARAMSVVIRGVVFRLLEDKQRPPHAAVLDVMCPFTSGTDTQGSLYQTEDLP